MTRRYHKLTSPARVGSTVFGKGVSERLVIDRAKREYAYRGNERPTTDPIKVFLRETMERRMPGYSRLQQMRRLELIQAAFKGAKVKAKKKPRVRIDRANEKV